MKINIAITMLTLIAFSGCSKDADLVDNPEQERLVAVKSSYQTYSYGQLSKLKYEWENWQYNDKSELEYSKTYLNYEYNDRLLIPYESEFLYNDNGTIKELTQSSLTSKTVARFEYNSDKQIVKRETWGQSGLLFSDTYVYSGSRLSEIRGSSIIVYTYDEKGGIESEEYFKDEKREPWFKYVYERDQKGRETKKTQVNLDRNTSVVLNEASYKYGNEGQLIEETSKTGVLGKSYIIKYEYNAEGTLLSKQIKRKLLSNYDDWMFITYEYIYE